MTAITACQYCRKLTGCDCADPDGPSTRAQFAEAIANLNYAAKRCIPRTNEPHGPLTKWDKLHRQINDHVTLWELAE